jgi:hypothetical protein
MPLLRKPSCVGGIALPGMNSIARRSPVDMFPGISLTNVSLKLNYNNGFFCAERDGYLSFTPNRAFYQGRYSVLYVLIIFYPPEQLSAHFRMVCSVLQRLSLRFALSPSLAPFLIL